MLKRLLIVSLIPASALAECVLHDRMVTQSNVRIEERSAINRVVVSAPQGQRCMVNFKARVGSTWYWANGQYDWPGDRPNEEACAVAVARAEDSVRERVGRSQVITEKTLICNDNPDLRTLRQTNPGTMGDLSQFRPHPEYTREFWHNGAPCRFFLDSAFVGADIRTFQGVICKVHDSKWVVVDKF